MGSNYKWYETGSDDFKEFFRGRLPTWERTMDPYKETVASPMSKYLAESIGKGLPRYTGEFPKLGPGYESRYSEFIGMEPEKWFQEKVTEPTMKEWRKEAVPLIEEGWAGSLRGSGRFRDVEESAYKMGETLGRLGGEAIPSIYTQQLAAGIQRIAPDIERYKAEYADWIKSLPEMNPTLQKALDFLGIDFSDIIVDPGSEPWYKGIFG